MKPRWTSSDRRASSKWRVISCIAILVLRVILTDVGARLTNASELIVVQVHVIESLAAN